MREPEGRYPSVRRWPTTSSAGWRISPYRPIESRRSPGWPAGRVGIGRWLRARWCCSSRRWSPFPSARRCRARAGPQGGAAPAGRGQLHEGPRRGGPDARRGRRRRACRRPADGAGPQATAGEVLYYYLDFLTETPDSPALRIEWAGPLPARADPRPAGRLVRLGGRLSPGLRN